MRVWIQWIDKYKYECANETIWIQRSRWIQYRIHMNWCNRIKWAKKYLDLRRQKTKVRLELAGYHGQWSVKHECTICFLHCLSKNACYLSINSFNNHNNQWVWSLICCEYGIWMQFVHSFGIPCTDRWSVEKVACGCCCI